MRSHHLSLVDTSWFYSALTLGGGGLGILGGGFLADKLGKGNRSAYPLIPAVAFVVGLPCFFLAVNTSSLWLAFPLFLIPTALNLAWLGPIVTSVQHLVPAREAERIANLDRLGLSPGDWDECLGNLAASKDEIESFVAAIS